MPSRYSPDPTPGITLTASRPAAISPAAEWDQSSNRLPPEEPEGVLWSRYFDVVRRYAIFIVAITLIGSGAGYLASKRVKPVYEAQATVWINASNAQQTGPIRAQQLLPSQSWVELLRSFAIVDPVIREMHLNVAQKIASDSVLFRGFESTDRLRPGAYILKVDATGARYSIADSRGVAVERGPTGDSVGRSLGFNWLPDRQFLTPGRKIEFSVGTVRGTASALLDQMHASLPEQGQFLRMTLSGSNPNRVAGTVNAWAQQLVQSSGELKARHLLEFKKTLEEQLTVAETQLHGSESALEQFRVQTITLPSAGSTTASGVAATDPVVSSYFQQKVALDEVRSERAALESMLAAAKGGPLNPQAFLQLPAILNDAPQLRAAIDELSSRQAALRTEQQFLTDQNPRVKQLAEAVRVLQQETIPHIAVGVLSALRAREPALDSRINAQSQELRAIPTRATEEMRLVRQVVASENLYNSLKSRYEEVSMAEAQSTPDLSVLDLAAAPQYPETNDRRRLQLLAVLASLGFAVAISLLRDRLDRRIRYPEHATRELGLLIAGTVPRFKPSRGGDFELATMSQAVESFRTLRLAVRYNFPADAPVVVAISSPSAGDGKSLVASNLALAFASSGNRTLLIDGDVRRGGLHTTFGIPVTPGLVEYLHGTAGLDAIVKPTSSENLFVIPRGARNVRAPEMLVSDLMTTLILGLRRQYDVVIVDSPPLVAGIDAYALAAAAGSMLIVLRPGVTDRKLAAAKLDIVDRLPIRILGTVLNGVPDDGAYRYYGTDYDYAGA
ncbi:MAG TPA: polysaccharide biosynthesis tyrosine autokinase, partial [Gemmatimonadaceae bacterium]|nr:polysaccharide biosynthesis tyrosine autokinase [Gemmatimonadaceae bacterium]